MKKLNRKGFTLIELLAVIVILAVVLVVTIPSVLNTMATARQKQFENALTVIEDYIQKQYDICSLGGTLGTDDYESDVVTRDATTGACSVANGGEATAVTKAGYDNEIVGASVASNSCAGDKCTITGAKATVTGKFKGATFGTPNN